MRFTDLFIRRPLLAWVLNALILLFGLVAFGYLKLRPYPDIQPAAIHLDTVYPGASQRAVAVIVGFPGSRPSKVTTPRSISKVLPCTSSLPPRTSMRPLTTVSRALSISRRPASCAFAVRPRSTTTSAS